jgi:hypothetical protein
VNMTLTKPVILVVLAACTTGCGQMKFVEADQCVLVDLQQEDGYKLVPDLDAFARTHALTPNKSAARMLTYTLHANGHQQAMISYSVGVSEHGAELALFNLGGRPDGTIETAFTEFVDRQVKPRYGVKRCADVPGYEPMKASG